jgi:hypothetical protein
LFLFGQLTNTFIDVFRLQMMTTEGDVDDLQAQLQQGTVIAIQAPNLVSLAGDVTQAQIHKDGTTAIIEGSTNF